MAEAYHSGSDLVRLCCAEVSALYLSLPRSLLSTDLATGGRRQTTRMQALKQKQNEEERPS
jgi:hypothetical protein